MTTRFSVSSLEDAGWNRRLVDRLDRFKCSGLEASTRSPFSIENQEAALQKIEEVLARSLPDYRYLVATGSALPEKDSKLVRHLGLSRLIQQSFADRSSDELTEWSVQNGEEIRHFSVFGKGRVQPDKLIEAWRRWRTTWLLAVAPNVHISDIREVLENGWSDEFPMIDQTIVRLASDLDVVCIRDMRHFDDPGTGVVAIASQQKIARILKAV